jgi:integrase
MAKAQTIKAIETAKSKADEYKLTVDRGLYIRVAPSGVKTWLIRYVILGKQKQYTHSKPFGTGGDGFMSLAEAKTLNANIQAFAREGIDYQASLVEAIQKKSNEKKLKADAELTFQNLYDAWIKDGVNRADGNKYITQSFGKHALPVLGSIQIQQLTEHHLRDLYRAVIVRGTAPTAVELSKDINQMLHWADARKPWRQLLADGVPSVLVDINLLLPDDYTKERTRLLSPEEIQKLKLAFSTTTEIYRDAPVKIGTERPIKKEVQIAMWLCLSTLCRIGELLKTEWQDVNLDARTWFIPASNTKGERGKKRSQLIYLSDFSLRNFQHLHNLTGESRWAFPATYKDSHVDEKSASKAIGDRQVQFKSRTKKLQSRVENNSLVLGTQEWTPHDLRRTGATQMQRLKIHRDVINLCQNHVIGTKVDRVYLLDEYADEKREAWYKLGDWLDEILNTKNEAPLETPNNGSHGQIRIEGQLVNL